MKRRDDLERLNNMSDADLKEEAARLKESLFRLNFKLALGEVDAVKTVRREKKTLARVQTMMRARQQEQKARALAPYRPPWIERQMLAIGLRAALDAERYLAALEGHAGTALTAPRPEAEPVEAAAR